MKHLIIKHIGPISEVDIELQRINLLIGEQSSGKSTINKIACYCSWVEKEISTAQSAAFFEEKGVFESRLAGFHKLEGFFTPQTYIGYETDVMRFSFSKKEESFSFEWKDRWNYIRPKTIYIPAERNIVASIPNWFDVKLKENNIRSFMSDWEEARTYYSGQPIGILNLGVNYTFEKTNRHDTVLLENNKTINFTNASSGLQSLIPLLVILQYITKGLYDDEGKDTINNRMQRAKLFREVYNMTLENSPLTIDENSSSVTIENEIVDLAKTTTHKSEGYLAKIDNFIELFPSRKDAEKCRTIFKNISQYHYSNIFLEEPEQNLYPTTQYDFINYLAGLTNAARRHNVFITTHSPYVLTSLNNLLYASRIGQTRKGEARMVVPMKYWVQFEDVGAWLVKNGTTTSIMDRKLKQIKAEKIDEVSRRLNRDYDKLLDLEYETD